MLRTVLLFLTVFASTRLSFADELEWVRVSNDGKGFMLTQSGTPFLPWGFNYDHEGDGQLIEDYWDDKWPTVESAFQEPFAELFRRLRIGCKARVTFRAMRLKCCFVPLREVLIVRRGNQGHVKASSPVHLTQHGLRRWLRSYGRSTLGHFMLPRERPLPFKPAYRSVD